MCERERERERECVGVCVCGGSEPVSCKFVCFDQVLFPLIVENHVGMVESYVNKNPEWQKKLLAHLDQLSSPDTCFGPMLLCVVFFPRSSHLHTFVLSTVLTFIF